MAIAAKKKDTTDTNTISSPVLSVGAKVKAAKYFQYNLYINDILFPVPPPKMTVKINNSNKTLTLINEGEINILKTPGLTDITFKLLLPVAEYPFANFSGTLSFEKPSYYLGVLEDLKVNCKSFDFVLSRSVRGTQIDENTSMKVSLEDYSITEDATDGRDMSVEIKLRQYKSFGTKTVTIKQESAVTEEVREEPVASTTKDYTVVKGDTLWGIAKTHLGSGARWTEIYELNKDLIEATAKKYGKASSSNGHWIYPGTVLKIPS